jgi:hypothetical protein
VPAAGQYVLASNPEDTDSPLAEVLFPFETSADGFLTRVPAHWNLHQSVHLRGPLGKRFTLPHHAENLALIVLGRSPNRLLPLLATGLNTTLFTDTHDLSLAAAVEIQPLQELSELLNWADFSALDIPLETLPSMRRILGLGSHQRWPHAAQALVTTPMPCGGMSDCAVCAVPARKGTRLACKEGPVFHLKGISW